MFSSISWEQFILSTVGALGVYYSWVGFSYYRKDWLYRLSGKKTGGASLQPAQSPVTMPVGVAAANPLLPLVHDLVDEIRALLQAEGVTAEKEDLLGKLRRLLQKYPTLNETSLQPSINQLIAIDCKNHCSMDLDETEIRALWQV
ncbi:MAG TPA: hypothetical protein VGR89_04785 [Puia sp.]|nr:hypothetical protein [Puia sp.]